MKKRKSKHRKKALKRTLEKFGSNLMKKEIPGVQGVRIRQAGEIKISKVLEEFIDPYMNPDLDSDQFRLVIQIAVLAWNASLMPAEIGRKMVDQTVDAVGPSKKEDAHRIVEGLVERKKKFFSQYNAWIVDFQVTDLDNGGYHLSVASTEYEERDNLSASYASQ